MAYVSKVRDIGSGVDHSTFTMADVESNMVRCPDQAAAKLMIDGASWSAPTGCSPCAAIDHGR